VTVNNGTTGQAAVLVESRGPVMLITINRPEARNAVNADVATAVGMAVDAASSDPEVRAVVLTGAGDRAFSAGADLVAVSRGEDIGARGHPEWGFAGFVRQVCGKPTIAAVNGVALGGGTEICLACDLVVAAPTAAFGLPEVKRGIMAGAGGAFRLPRTLPQKIAMEILLTGEPIDAEAARRWGMVNRLVPLAEVVEAALDLATGIAANAPLSVQASKRVALGIHDRRRPREDALWALTATEARRLMTSSDAAEGPRAFAEKRAPVWRGC
jgi:crotonobetainyl-CoA hydratase